MNLRTLNQRLIADKIRAERAADDYERRREEVAAALLAAHEELGLVQAEVTIPGIGKVATVTLKRPAAQVDPDEEKLLAVVEQNQPTEVEEVIDPQVLEDEEVMAWLREHRPDAVTRRVRVAWRGALLREAKDKQGRIQLDSGEIFQIAKVTLREPDGAFQLTVTATDEELLATALDSPDNLIPLANGDGADTEAQPAPSTAKNRKRREGGADR